MTNTNMNIYVTNLAAYTNGDLIGKWINLPMDPDDLQDEINSILENDEEYAIHDTENIPFSVGEYDDINELNTSIEILSKYDANIIEAINEYTGDIDETLRILENNEFSYVENVHDEKELALNVDECLLPFDYEAVKKAGADLYIDWEAIGRDMVCSSEWYIASNNIAVSIYY